MRILFAGSTGLIGKALVPYLKAIGHEVIALTRHKEEEAIYWDPENGEINPSELEDFEGVINFAGDNIAGRWSEAKKSKILESRVKTTRLLADTLAHLVNPPKVWINASAVGFYGSQGDKVLAEENGAGTGFLPKVCQAWEAATEAAVKRGIRVVHARFGVVLSVKGGMLGRLLMPFKLGLGGKVGDGKQYMSWIEIDDLLGIIRHILLHEELSGPVNVVAPHAATNGEFTEVLGRLLHRPTLFAMPAPVAKLVFGKEMAEEMLLSSTRVYPKKLLESEYVFQYPTIEGALKHLIDFK